MFILKKIFKILFKNKIIGIVSLIIIIAGLYFGYQGVVKDGDTVRYAAAAVEKGNLIVTVSGSGQVSVLDQIEIKPKTSGKLAALYIGKGQEVKNNELLAVLDSKDARQTVRDAEIALESANIKLEELLLGADAKSLLQAENALLQAERDLEKAKENYDEISIDAESTLKEAYENGYKEVSTAFFKLSDYMKDLKDFSGIKQSLQEYITDYKSILGADSPFIQRFLKDYEEADKIFNESFAFFRQTSQNDGRESIYRLIEKTYSSVKTVTQAIESARHLLDAMMLKDYQYFTIASHIDKMQSKIESNLSSAYANITSLGKIKETIDDANKNTPKKIKDAELAIKTAEEKLAEKKVALEELRAGTNPQDIKAQKNTIAQKESVLLDSKEKLAECFIYAPFGGVIAEINAQIKKGELISSSQVIATLISRQKIAEISLNEVDAAKIKPDQKTNISFDALPDLSITGKVIDIDTLGNVSQGVVSYNVKIAFDIQDESIKPGMSTTVDIITDVRQNVLLVPNGALKSQGSLYFVQLVEESEVVKKQLLANSANIVLLNAPKQQPVEVGLSGDLKTEIINGLSEGSIVVTSVTSANQTQTSQTQRNQSFQIPGMGGGGPQMRIR